MKEPILTNLRILESRKQPKAGDIFVVSPSMRGYFFGRLVATDAEIGSMPNCHLLYLFATESETKHFPSRLLIGDLLVPPLMTNRLPWSRGYFETVGHREFLAGERLPVHCFRELGRQRISALEARKTTLLDEQNHALGSADIACGTDMEVETKRRAERDATLAEQKQKAAEAAEAAKIEKDNRN